MLQINIYIYFNKYIKLQNWKTSLILVSINKLQLVQNAAARILTRTTYMIKLVQFCYHCWLLIKPWTISLASIWWRSCHISFIEQNTRQKHFHSWHLTLHARLYHCFFLLKRCNCSHVKRVLLQSNGLNGHGVFLCRETYWCGKGTWRIS